jgi:hypothetical protein
MAEPCLSPHWGFWMKSQIRRQNENLEKIPSNLVSEGEEINPQE